MIDIADLRKRHANAIANTATGMALGAALDELQMMRACEESIRRGRAVSTNLLEVSAENMEPAKWAAMMILKGTNPQMTTGEAMDLIEGTIRHALYLMLKDETRP